MLKYLLAVTLFNVAIICGDKNDDDAFVNSLPQEQKKEFLKKVEERIEHEVREPKFPVGNDTNIDLFEQRLYDQGKLVKEIVREEIDSLKRRNNDQPSVKSNSKELNDNNEHESRIDLTLRSTKDEENATTHQAASKRTQIPVAVKYDENYSKGKRDVKDMASEIYDNVTLASNESTEVHVNRIARRSGNGDAASDDNKESANHNVNDSVVAVADTSTNSIDVTSHDIVVNTLQENDTIDFSAKPNGDNSTIAAVTTEFNNNKNNRDDGTTRGNITDRTGVIDTTTISYADTSQESVTSTKSYENPKSYSVIGQHKGVTSRPITTQNYITSMANYNVSTNEVDNTTEWNDSVSTTPKDLTTTLYTVNNSKRSETTTKNYNDATTTQNQTALQRDDVNYAKDDITFLLEPNEQTKDPSKEDNENSKEENENQPLFVPVHNYNPENAYFNTFNNQGPDVNNNKQIISQSTSTIIKKIENRSKSKTADIHSLFVSSTNKTNLRIDDIKENASASDTSNTEIEINADDIMSSGEIRHLFNSKTKSVNMQSRDDIFDEKPLKHSLKKIREILFQHNIRFDKLDDDRSISDNSPKLEVGYGFPQKDRVITPTVQFNTFGSLLKNLVDHADETRYVKSKPKIDKYVIDSDNDVYNNVMRSLKKHNEKLQNTVLYQTIKTLEYIQKRMGKKRLRNTIDKPKIISNQTRFKIKSRDNRKPGPYSLEEDISNLAIKKATNEKYETNKPTTLKIRDNYLRLHANILRDLVEQNDMGLENYDWLTTTVNIQAAIAKLQNIIEKKRNYKVVHHLDHRLLKLVTSLYKTAIKTVIERENLDTPTRKHFHHKFKLKKNKKLESSGNKHGGKRSNVDIEDFGRTLDCLRNCLNDLHTAIKQISLITTYKNQHWFQNLKQLYLKSAKEKEYLEILLHLVSARLFGLLEDTAETIFAEDEDFLKKNRAEFDRIGVEFVMLIKICNGLMRLNG